MPGPQVHQQWLPELGLEVLGEDADEDPTVCNDPYAPPLSPPR